MRRAILFIDGQYLTHIERHYEMRIPYSELACEIARTRGVHVEQTYYYTAPPFQGTPPAVDEKQRKAGYDRFLRALTKQGIAVREGRCQKIGGTYAQKGVDTLLTIDLIRMRQNHPDAQTALVLTGDTDFVPAIRAAQDDRIDVVLIYAEDRSRHSKIRLANALLAICPNRVRITPELIERVRNR